MHLMKCFHTSQAHLKYFPRFEEARVFLAAEGEQAVQGHPAVLLLKHEAVSVPGGPRGARRAAAAGASALPARVLDQALLPPAEGLHHTVRLHLCWS